MLRITSYINRYNFRCFLIAGEGTTRHYSRSGYFVNSFPSLLPGGNRKFLKSSQAITFLDCIYVDIESTYYILDIMVWKDFSFYDCDTECRRFLAVSKLSENEDLAIKSRLNPYKFKVLPAYSCHKESIERTLSNPMNFHPLALDGLLFYNKQVHYLPGSTPLVGWLKGYMVPELLSINVSQELKAQKPNNYATMKSHIQEYSKERQEKKAAKERPQIHQHQ